MRYFYIHIRFEDHFHLYNEGVSPEDLEHNGYYKTELDFEEVFFRLGHHNSEHAGMVIEYVRLIMFEFSDTYAEIECRTSIMLPESIINKPGFIKVEEDEVPKEIEQCLFYVVLSDYDFKNVEAKRKEIEVLIPNAKSHKETYSIEGGLSYGEILHYIGVSVDFLGEMDGAVGGVGKIGTAFLILKNVFKRRSVKVALPKKTQTKILKKVKNTFGEECHIDLKSCKLSRNGIVTCICKSNTSSNKFKVLFDLVQGEVKGLKDLN